MPKLRGIADHAGSAYNRRCQNSGESPTTQGRPTTGDAKTQRCAPGGGFGVQERCHFNLFILSVIRLFRPKFGCGCTEGASLSFGTLNAFWCRPGLCPRRRRLGDSPTAQGRPTTGDAKTQRCALALIEMVEREGGREYILQKTGFRSLKSYFFLGCMI